MATRIAKLTFAAARALYPGRVVQEGQAFDESHPVVQKHSHNFVTPDEYAERNKVEQATRRPGEKRGAVKPPAAKSNKGKTKGLTSKDRPGKK